ncbi:hypothetical protein [Micromonospora echinofusca]|uniref:hypothetical protein n=1 Tax=Micromonospora echinofusca TaxID=47858 RepID=UPI003714182C
MQPSPSPATHHTVRTTLSPTGRHATLIRDFNGRYDAGADGMNTSCTLDHIRGWYAWAA